MDECTADVDGYEPACCACPALATCMQGATIETIVIKKDTWRHGFGSPQVLPCDSKHACAEPLWSGVNGTNGSAFCNRGYEGPLCSRCVDQVIRPWMLLVAVARVPRQMSDHPIIITVPAAP